MWIAIDRRARKPALSYPPLRIVRTSSAALEQGVARHRIDGRMVRITNVARTLADCFKYRNKIGLDVALEALRDAWRSKRLDLRELEGHAAANRVQRVMQPYLEALVS
ncbi:MAG: hypothetical protein JNM84_25245 [Planctomycetes bacterium]|nr:hypothetical protein [Planctomycetota bacterium]